ncbi:MAG: hypothetical protein KKD35_05215 [Elusimicrobia bacterium]|nr:hypothetical protein [Elusimicrobiota bacterium]
MSPLDDQGYASAASAAMLIRRSISRVSILTGSRLWRDKNVGPVNEVTREILTREIIWAMTVSHQRLCLSSD